MKKQTKDAVRELVKDMVVGMGPAYENRVYLKTLLNFLAEQLEQTHTDAEWAGEMVRNGHFEQVSRILEDASCDLPDMLARMAVALRRERDERAKGGVK